MNRFRLASVLLTCSIAALRAQGAANYLSRLQEIVDQTRANLTVISRSAERAASDFVAGGNLYAAGNQEDFIAEACGRAGGLMAIQPLGRQVPTEHDVILYGIRGQIDSGALNRFSVWEKSGARVVKFSSSAGLFEGAPLDTVANVIELWTWTGEFVAACTRLGKMPVLYQSYGLPGGPQRGKKYQGKRFHDDIAIRPIQPGALGRAYLEQIERMLAGVNKTQMPKILQAAEWWKRTPASATTALVTGHMFPSHGKDPRIGPITRFLPVQAWEDKNLLDTNAPPLLVIYLGYQFAPKKLLEQTKGSGVKLVYSDVQADDLAEPDTNTLYVAPGWPLTDACVTVPGYDIPILPASGILQAAIFWSMVSERNNAALAR